MAGIDTNYVGRIGMSKGYTIGYLEQEPQLIQKNSAAMRSRSCPR